MQGADAVIHGAAIYEIGIPKSRREPMYQANVVGTQNALGAALDAKIPRVVYISTIGAFGNTKGEVVDETYDHPGQSFTSYYEETKYEAHQVAKGLIADGLPCVMVQPGGVYGPDDHSAIGKQIMDFASGRLPFVAFPEVGMNMVHVEDVADRRPARARQGRDRRVLRPRRRDHHDARLIDTTAKVMGKREAAGQHPHERPQGRRADWTRDRQAHGPAAEHARAHLLVRRRHLLGVLGQGRGEARLRAAPLDRGLRETLEAEGKL